MKKGIHPKLYKNTKVTDLSSGDTFVVVSTKEEITVEASYLSHPFYTGKQRIVDTENLVKKFEAKRQVANSEQVTKKREKRRARSAKTTSINANKSLTLKDMLQSIN